MSQRKSTKYIVIHAADTYPDMDIGFAEIDRWHRQRGWLMCGYHYIIRRDGTVETGREQHVPGAHVRGYNSVSLGICMVGGKSRATNGAEDNFTPAQRDTLATMLQDLRKIFPEAEIVGHRDLDPHKECPCFDVGTFLTERDI